VKKGVPRMEMVHHLDVMVELSTHLLAAARDRVSPHSSAELERHYPRILEDGRGSGQ
jgi:hypothetical protein